jgi:hypothetical protein
MERERGDAGTGLLNLIARNAELDRVAVTDTNVLPVAGAYRAVELGVRSSLRSVIREHQGK